MCWRCCLPPQRCRRWILRRAVLAAALTAAGEVPAVVVARALAELLDDRYGHRFAESFRRRSPTDRVWVTRSRWTVPTCQVTALPATSPPWRLANRLDETRHVRLAGDCVAEFQLIFDYSHADALPYRPGHGGGDLPSQPEAERVRVPSRRPGPYVPSPSGR
jgi:hypothetical protein